MTRNRPALLRLASAIHQHRHNKMKAALLLYSITSLLIVDSVAARSSPHLIERFRAAISKDQSPIMAPVVPPSNEGGPSSDSSDGVVIADIIGKTRHINIFGGFTRDIDTVASRLEDASKNTTVLAPENGAIMQLPRKPWEDTRDYDQYGANAYDGSEGEDRAHKNLRRFVEAHVVPESPWRENQRMTTLAGNTIWFENRDGRKVVSLACHQWNTGNS